MSTFDEDLVLKGLEQRKATLGAGYAEKNLAAADDFTRPFHEAMTAWCRGLGWGDDVIPAKTRSMMNLAMIGAPGKTREREIHRIGALTGGVSKEEKAPAGNRNRPSHPEPRRIGRSSGRGTWS